MSGYHSYSGRLDPTPRVMKRSGPFHPEEPLKSVADALAFCEERGLDPAKVRLAHNYVTWESEETEAEIKRRIEWATKARDEHVAWVKQVHDEYEALGLFTETEDQA